MHSRPDSDPISDRPLLALTGDAPVRTRHWPRFDKGDVDIGDQEAAAVARVLNRRLLFRYDERPHHETEVGAFERQLCEFLGVRHALAVSSGTAALALSFMALGIRPGDEVLCSAFAFAADPSSILLAGGTPVLVDSGEDLHMDVADLERRITPHTRAILVVHQRGQAGNLTQLLDVAARHALPVVEDAVPALGARIGDRYLGSFGTFGAFSTQADKSLNTGEGGFLVTSDTKLYERAVLLSGAYEGRVRKHCSGKLSVAEHSLPLFNFRMDEMRGAIAQVQLAKLPRRLEALRDNYGRVNAILARYPEIRIRRSCVPEATLGHYVVFRLDDSDAVDAQWVAAALNAEGIEARCFGRLGRPNLRSFWNWGFLYPGLAQDEIRALLPATTRQLDLTVDIPLSPLLTVADIADLEAAIDKVMLARRKSRRSGATWS